MIEVIRLGVEDFRPIVYVGLGDAGQGFAIRIAGFEDRAKSSPNLAKHIASPHELNRGAFELGNKGMAFH
ncbi:hypothetical protein [Pseudomonas aeruginosa]|uniref:hypothetical protein n=1 Tax=Pseudomonas aeruginosa TaxID=287 RepID=UPI0011B21AAE|nr:hypothetical protein [Pseudomonas aeruginosa]ELG5196917.1 hypothetical protein [Pseudomonas aeruginosa]HEP8826803.1 hypothetical protein [Pseudomonas aeruginosa]HEP8847839.1 hypothetical protein [Pseudomonas aeruginosa]